MRFPLALGALILALVPLSWAQVYDLTLYHTDPETLSPEARIHHDSAVEALNRIDYVTAVREMGLAAEAAPDSAEMQSHFITLALRTVRPDSYDIEESLQIADQVLDAYDRILAKEDLPQFIRDFFGRERGDFEVMLDGIAARIQRRRNLNQAYSQSYAAEMRQVEEARSRYRVSKAQMATEAAAQPATLTERAIQGEAVEANPSLPLRNRRGP